MKNHVIKRRISLKEKKRKRESEREELLKYLSILWRDSLLILVYYYSQY